MIKRISTKGLAKEYDFQKYPGGFGIVFRSYIQGAIRKGLSFVVSADVTYDMMSKPCHYCGCQPSNQTLDFIYNGIDRVRADTGYTLDNIVPCCKLCNGMKSKLDIDTFLNHIKLIHDYNEEDLQG